ncbi:hypothetical protein NE237_028312 [Protea cynaroides]|uniref:Uncharacterized protein n=1 Tax=Protea cynaroides TaxID=273540 RepID=A0A9Q0GQ22_9MAGN|nr:hypothetical protein NE237_028312 [Protea cynaroides]
METVGCNGLDMKGIFKRWGLPSIGGISKTQIVDVSETRDTVAYVFEDFQGLSDTAPIPLDLPNQITHQEVPDVVDGAEGGDDEVDVKVESSQLKRWGRKRHHSVKKVARKRRISHQRAMERLLPLGPPPPIDEEPQGRSPFANVEPQGPSSAKINLGSELNVEYLAIKDPLAAEYLAWKIHISKDVEAYKELSYIDANNRALCHNFKVYSFGVYLSYLNSGLTRLV